MFVYRNEDNRSSISYFIIIVSKLFYLNQIQQLLTNRAMHLCSTQWQG